MKARLKSSNEGMSALTAFLAAGVIAIIAIMAVMIAALSAPGNAPPVPLSGSEASATPSATVTNVTDVTPTPAPEPTPHKLSIVVGKSAGPTPTPTPAPDGGMYFEEQANKTARHIAYAFEPDVNGIADFSATWIIPERPKYDGGPKHTIFLWTGIQKGTQGLIQCVLEWDHDNTGKYWTLACWVVNARDQMFNVSTRIDAYPGDQVRAEMRYETDPYDPYRKVWHLIMTDETHEVSTDLYDSNGAVDTNDGVIVFSGVLEGIGSVSEGDDLPGDMMFRDIAYKNEYGQDMPMHLSGVVSDGFPHVAVEYEDESSGSPVIIRTNYGAKN